MLVLCSRLQDDPKADEKHASMRASQAEARAAAGEDEEPDPDAGMRVTAPASTRLTDFVDLPLLSYCTTSMPCASMLSCQY